MIKILSDFKEILPNDCESKASFFYSLFLNTSKKRSCYVLKNLNAKQLILWEPEIYFNKW